MANFVKKTDFHDKLKKLNKNELNELSKPVKEILRKGFLKCLINKFSILNGSKYSPSGIFQNYLVLMQAKNYITKLNRISGFFTFFWLLVWPDGINECG